MKWMVHPGAVYLHDGRTYVVDELNLDDSIVRLSPQEIDYYTEPKQETKVSLIQTSRSLETPPLAANYGEIQITTRVTGYRKISWQTGQVLQTLPLELPETTFQTTSLLVQHQGSRGRKTEGSRQVEFFPQPVWP